MKVFDSFESGSLEWFCVRAGVITASEADNLVSPKWEVRKGKGVESYVAQKAAEKWIQGPLPGYMTANMEIGNVLENEAIPWLEWEYGWKLSRPAFIGSDDMTTGCSPDAMSNDCGVEVKCPGPLNHVKYLLENRVPDDYLAQVQFSLGITQFKKWLFVSYRRGFPALVVPVFPDPIAQAAIAEALKLFKPKLKSAMERLIRLNGGQPPKPNPFREALLRPRENEETETIGITP